MPAQNKPATSAAVKAEDTTTSVLDKFQDKLVQASGLLRKYETGTVLARVVFGTVLGAMYAAEDNSRDKLADDASKTQLRDRRNGIRDSVLSYVMQHTGRDYTWNAVEAWIDAAVVNATLDSSIQVKVVKGDVVGVFGVWPLRALGWIEDTDKRSKFALQLAADGITTQDAVEAAVKGFLGQSTETAKLKAKAVKAMSETLDKRVKSKLASELGAAKLLTAQIGDADVAEVLADFGRMVWMLTPSDPAIEDAAKRQAKRVRTFKMSLATLLFIEDDTADPDDGINEEDAV